MKFIIKTKIKQNFKNIYHTTFSWIWLLDTDMLMEACPKTKQKAHIMPNMEVYEHVAVHKNLFLQTDAVQRANYSR